MYWLKPLFLCLILGTYTSTLAKIVGPSDDRRLIDQIIDVNPSVIAIVKDNNRTICTGTTIGVSFFVTAAHCVIDKETGEVRKGLTAIPGLHMALNHKPHTRFHLKRAWVLNGFSTELAANGFTRTAASKDIAIVQVREFDGNEFFSSMSPAMEFASSNQLDIGTETYSTTGYSQDSEHHFHSQYRQSNCMGLVFMGEVETLPHDCDTSPDTSGAALIASDGRIKAIHVAFEDGLPYNEAAVIPPSAIRDIQNILGFETDNITHFQEIDLMTTPYWGIELTNHCSEWIRVAHYFYDQNHQWTPDGFEWLSPGQKKIMNSQSSHYEVLVHAQSESGLLWNGPFDFPIHGNQFGFYKQSLNGSYVDTNIEFHCDPQTR